MAKKKSQKWDVNNEVDIPFDEGTAPCFRLWPTEGEMTALLDADMFPYIVGFCQSEEDWFKALRSAEDAGLTGDEAYEFMCDLKCCQQAIDHCNSMVNEWTENAGCDSALLYLTEGRTQYRFKTAFSKQYKGTRPSKKPPFFGLIKWYLQAKHNAIVASDEEADDLMAIEQYQRNELMVSEGAKQGSKQSRLFSGTVIVTKDKDLRMIPGWHSNPDIDKGKPFWVDRIGFLEPVYDANNKMTKLAGGGLKFFYAQMLMGDTVDNYGGLPGMGCTTAYKLLNHLDKEKELHKAVKEQYKFKFGEKPFTLIAHTGIELRVKWKDMWVEQGRLAWMQTKPGELWQKKHELPDPDDWDWDKPFKEN